VASPPPTDYSPIAKGKQQELVSQVLAFGVGRDAGIEAAPHVTLPARG